MQGAIPMSDAKIRRPKAETPKGFRDYFGAEVTERVIGMVRNVLDGEKL